MERSPFTVAVATDWSVVAPAWQRLVPLCRATPFQTFAWLDAWYRTIGARASVTPLLVTVTGPVDGQLVALLPLVIVQRGRLRVLQFADCELTDFNGPLLGPVAIPEDQHAAFWRSIVAELPQFDVAELRKMPRTIGGRINPLTTVRGAEACAVNGNVIRLGGTWKSYHQSIDRRVRMELERCWRVFWRDPTAEVVRITDGTEALAAIDCMDRQQRQRLTETGSTFRLDLPPEADFYRHDLERRLADGHVVIIALKSGHEIIAGLYAIADGQNGDNRAAVVLRISHGGKPWAHVSPGRLVVHAGLELMHHAGCTSVDLSIGEYDYKRRFGVEKVPLTDVVAAGSWRGQAVAARHWAAGQLRARPAIDRRVRKLFSQAVPRAARRA